MRTHSLVLIFALSFAVAACEKHEVPAGDAEAGRLFAQRNCQNCHAIGAADASALPAAPPLRDIVRQWPPENLAEAFAEGIQVSHDGSVDMPQFQLEPKQIDDLIAYLQTLRPSAP